MSVLAGLTIPIIQAPMVGASGVDMAVAVSKAGALGSLAAGALSPQAITDAARDIRRQTNAPFAINLFILEPTRPSGEAVAEALERLRPWYERLGASVPDQPNDFAPDFEAQLQATIEAGPAVASFTFGILTRRQVAALHAAGAKVVGTATTVAEARAWTDIGADAICAQGYEAGGHRGAFLDPGEPSLIGTLSLVAAIRAATDVPVIAAGGIMDGRGVAAALALGAAAAQMGTAFLLSDQSIVSAPWRAAIGQAPDDPTRISRAYSGRQARGIENDYMRAMRPVENDVPAYPVQNRLTQPLRAAAAAKGDASMLSLWAGQGVKLARTGDAGEMVKGWWDEARRVIADLAMQVGR